MEEDWNDMSTKDYLVQNMVSELVGYLMKDFGWDIQSAMKAVYHSALFQKLDDNCMYRVLCMFIAI